MKTNRKREMVGESIWRLTGRHWEWWRFRIERWRTKDKESADTTSWVLKVRKSSGKFIIAEVEYGRDDLRISIVW